MLIFASRVPVGSCDRFGVLHELQYKPKKFPLRHHSTVPAYIVEATVLLRSCYAHVLRRTPLHRSIATLRPQYGCVERSYGGSAV